MSVYIVSSVTREKETSGWKLHRLCSWTCRIKCKTGFRHFAESRGTLIGSHSRGYLRNEVKFHILSMPGAIGEKEIARTRHLVRAKTSEMVRVKWWGSTTPCDRWDSQHGRRGAPGTSIFWVVPSERLSTPETTRIFLPLPTSVSGPYFLWDTADPILSPIKST